MRLFQNSGLYPAYLPRLRSLTGHAKTFTSMRAAFLADRFGACHFLLPILDGDDLTFFTNGDDEVLQRQWARENGLRVDTSMDDILLAQIEHHRTEVFYNLDPMRYGSGFVRRLPGCVKRSIAWRAAPSPSADFSAYSLIVCNFPSILSDYRHRGWKSAYLAPAHDREMDRYAAQTKRSVDVLFVGGYSRHHKRRATILETVAALRKRYKVVFHLDRSRLTRLAESPAGWLLPLGEHRRPPNVRRVSAEPVFGRALYEAIGNAKIVLNGAVDMAGEDRGNMRCFEALGCGALMVSDTGRYPAGMVAGETILTYENPSGAVAAIEGALASPGRLASMAAAGYEMIRTQYSKVAQWADFQELVAKL